MDARPSAQRWAQSEESLRAKYQGTGLYVRKQVYARPDGVTMVVGGWAFLDGDPAILPTDLDLLVVTAGGSGPDLDSMGRDPQAVLGLLASYATRVQDPIEHWAVRVPEARRDAAIASIRALPEHTPGSARAPQPSRAPSVHAPPAHAPSGARVENGSARHMAINSAIRGLATLMLILGQLALMLHMLREATSGDPWGARLSPVAIGITGMVLIFPASVVLLSNFAAAFSFATANARGDYVLVRYGVAAGFVAHFAEQFVSGCAAGAGLLFSGALMDASSGRSNFIVVGMALMVYPLILAALSMRRISVLSSSRRALLISPFGSPWLARSIPFTEVRELEPVFGMVSAQTTRGDFELGALMHTHDSRAAELALHQLGAQLGLRTMNKLGNIQVSGPYDRVQPLPLP